MNKITPHEFYLKTNGQVIDVDGYYGGQCWDLFAYYCKLVLGHAFSCVKTGYVADFWNYFKECGLEPYFEKVTSNYQDGDWLLWTKPCWISNSSHIAMFRCDNGNGTMTILTQNPGYTTDPNYGKYPTKQMVGPYTALTGALRLKPQYTYEGNFEEVTKIEDNKYLIKGWYWDGTDATSEVHIYIRQGNERKFFVGVGANEYREDLKNAGKGNGNHAFNYEYDFDNLGAGTYDITVYQIRHDNNNQPLGTKTITIEERPIIVGPVIEQPVEVTEVPVINDSEQLGEQTNQEPSNTTEEPEVSKSGFKMIIIDILNKVLEYLRKRFIK